jgi:cyclohexyl-isocyanide hydratase
MSQLNIGFVIFPQLTQLDFTGPLQVLSRLPGAAMHIIAKSDAPVPGGFGVVQAIEDRETVEFVRRQAAGAKYVTSVCTGAFVLGAAGLLKGRRATTHWAYTDLLPMVGAVHEKARIVKDGNVITAGGVTSGIDFALSIAADIAGTAVAQSIQLSIEYDPAPPFDAGHPDRAPEAAKSRLTARYERSREAYRASLGRVFASP